MAIGNHRCGDEFEASKQTPLVASICRPNALNEVSYLPYLDRPEQGVYIDFSQLSRCSPAIIGRNSMK
jgi:hypothetical protein